MRKKRGLGLVLSAALLFSTASAQTYSAGSYGCCALVNDAGRIVCPVGTYEQILPVTQDIFAARVDEGWLLLDEKGEAISESVYEDVYGQDGYIFLKKGGLYAAADPQLVPMTEHQYTQIVPNGEGGFLALKTEPNDDRGDGVYLIDTDGKETATGAVIVYGLSGFSCGRSPAVGSGGKKTGYLGPDGKWAITAQYGHGAQFVADGLAVASADSGAGVIDVDGNWVISPKFESIELTDGNRVMAVRTGGGRIGLMDAQTREEIAELSGEGGYARTRGLKDMALVTMDGEVALYAADGTVLNTWEESTGAAVCMLGGDNLLLSMDGGEYLLDGQANELAGPYRRIDLMEEGLFAAQKAEGGCDLIDGTGKVLVETQYERIEAVGAGIMLAWRGDSGALIGRDGGVIVEMTQNAEA